MASSPNGPHQGQPVFTAGADPSDAQAAVILLHGRGASAQGMLQLADELNVSNVLFRAPQAARRTWYPQSFLAPSGANEPALRSALQVVDDLVQELEEGGLSADRIVLLGFSQGACLALEYAARHPQRYGGAVGLSGGLIGPEDEPLHYDGDLRGTPVFLGCSDQDPYIPLERVQATAEVLDAMGAEVTTRIYEGMGHTTNEDELRRVRDLLGRYVSLSARRTADDDVDEEALDDDAEDVYEEVDEELDHDNV